jgi:N-formylglutamate amidohydrolase
MIKTQDNFFTIHHTGHKPLVATAIHQGHALRPGLKPYINLYEQERLREEDPYTGSWTLIAPTQIVCFHSRFQVDLNRPREKAIYEKPEDAWGLSVWNTDLPQGEKMLSLGEYDGFYDSVKRLLDSMIERFGYCIIYDIHSYNAIRDGKEGSAVQNPEINIGTANMNREIWGEVVEAFMDDLRSFDLGGHSLDVRENVKFKGGYFTQWIYEQYGDRCCPIAIEMKKFFMDEVTGIPYPNMLVWVGQALQATTINLFENAEKIQLALK